MGLGESDKEEMVVAGHLHSILISAAVVGFVAVVSIYHGCFRSGFILNKAGYSKSKRKQYIWAALDPYSLKHFRFKNITVLGLH